MALSSNGQRGDLRSRQPLVSPPVWTTIATGVPRERHGIRGFNQAAEICALLQKSTGLPVIRNVRRRRATPYQSGLTASERRRNLRRDLYFFV